MRVLDRPNVRIVIGKVKSLNIGVTIKLQK